MEISHRQLNIQVFRDIKLGHCPGGSCYGVKETEMQILNIIDQLQYSVVKANTEVRTEMMVQLSWPGSCDVSLGDSLGTES